MNVVRLKSSLFSVILAAIGVFFCFTCVIAQEHGHLLDSPAFSDPGHVREMPSEWIDKGVKHPAMGGGVDLYMTLSYQLYDLFADKIRKFARDNSFSVTIRQASCSTSTRLLMEKQVDVASFCCSPSHDDRLPGVRFHTAGIVPVAILVNKNNPVEDVSLEDLMKIFRGEIVNWSQVGGEDMLIQPVARLHCRTRPGRWRPLNTPDELSQSVMLVGGIDDNLEFISQTRGSIGYGSLLGGTDRKYSELKSLSVNGIDSNDLTRLVHGDYPYFRSYTFAVWAGEEQEESYSRQVIELINHEIASLDNNFGILASTSLKKNGWQFSGDELVGLPK